MKYVWMFAVVAGCAEGAPTAQRGDTFVLGDLGGDVADAAGYFGVAADELRLVELDTDRLGLRHAVYRQVIAGRDVEGATLAIHSDPAGRIYAASGTARDLRGAPVAATIDADDAIARTAAAAGSAADLTYWLDHDGAVHLAWSVADAGQTYVDAVTGEIVGRVDDGLDALSREVRNERVSPARVYTESSPPPSGRPAERAAWTNVQRTYNCYSDVFDRDAVNGTGGLVKTALTTMQSNARWDKANNRMEFGRGTGTTYAATGFETSSDMVTHEYTHGVLLSVASLEYGFYTDGAALHEGLSDILAAVCQWHADDEEITGATFGLFEDIYTPLVAGDAGRYIDDPARDGRSLDYWARPGKDPHERGGIARLAFYLTAMGGTHPRGKSTLDVPALGFAEAAQIFYRAADVYFTERTSFADARAATELAAEDLYGSEAAIAVATAWAAVGVGTAP